MKLLKRRNESAMQINMRDSEAMLRSFAKSDAKALFDEFEVTSGGLSVSTAQERLEEDGANLITAGEGGSVWKRLLESIINPFNVVLLVIAAITFITDVIIAENNDFLTVIIIVVLVAISSLVAFVQGERSNSAAEKLSKMISNKVDVIRDGRLVEIDIEEVVEGDIVKLSAGDIIPADIRFVSAKDAFVAQAALTGESAPVEKFVEANETEGIALTDIANIGFMGSNMVSGSAEAIVLATGNKTYFGSMAKSLSGDRAKNSFERGVESISKLLIRISLIMVPVVFILNGFLKNDWASALLFSVTLAVGLTPEMLPVIMTSTLAKGATSMAKHKVIVKNLGAIQTFGEMDVLCTDKTGTLTEDKIILEKYMNLHGQDDSRILRHAFLNSYFQTGLKNLIDLAIINRAEEHEIDNISEQYERVDEIPFDFSRRRMSVVLADKSGKRQLITKGAVEEVVSICSFVELDGEIKSIDNESRKKAMALYEKHNADGLRMIAVAQKNDVAGVNVFNVSDESQMVLIGFVAFLDPPKASAASAISALAEHSVRTIVLTGDSEGVAIKVCNKVGIDASGCLTGMEVEAMSDELLSETVEKCNLYAKLSPSQKQRVVEALQKNRHTVGYMGDGINDAPPLRQADVGISVDSAVDIAKETADIILTQKDLMVLEQGIIEGRRTFGNIMKYIKMATSGNFGNVISVIVASVFLPFLPMLPVHILTQNLLCDFSQMGIPFDRVDDDYLKTPHKWDTRSLKVFMGVMGPVSSAFDILCFALLWWVLKANTMELAPMFQCGWFVFGTLSQIVIIYIIRTKHSFFLKSGASLPLYISTISVSAVVLLIGFTYFASAFDMMKLPVWFSLLLLLLLAGYCAVTMLFKKAYIKIFKEWI